MSCFKLVLLIFTVLFSLATCWYSRCDQAGRCTISETENGPQIYLTPGYLPLFPDTTIIPIKSGESNSGTFNVESLTGFSLHGPLSGRRGFECAGGLNECVNSCCVDGYCAGPSYNCEEKKDDANLLYIITSSIFGGLIIFYWVFFFVLGCNYNKHILKTQKEVQNYGKVVKDNHNENEEGQKNQTIEENDEIDEPAMRSHGTLSGDEKSDRDQDIDEEEQKRRKMQLVASKLDQLNRDHFEMQPEPMNMIEDDKEDEKEDKKETTPKDQKEEKLDSSDEHHNVQNMGSSFEEKSIEDQ